ncbi:MULTISPECIES: LSm family protein [Geobacillus]|uniref:LSM domain protein n=5 Tax=root TaxID=1 RepID=A0A3L7CW74_GEOSE|nr:MULTISPECIES: hypothetical protein [Geobacillus]YP_008240329.1 hypothetical protein N352_gp25 [Thermus phage phi OH2]AEV17632.1 hypothetical protein GTCCBUS3UF5_3060 [Geobacillus thermoleovorans CCB_US3_UF5]AMQ22245.1 hypothetical protein A0V43_16910 [Geobacillus sp. JS12]AWO74963.1 hypothetical protein C1N76_10975 [Geobacillus thermoleovorans]MBW7642563.1 hypothetical protein [Geobacillus thermoleovorans]MED4333334.1 hypothetical protein [Geobacillus stearothermophilus]
MRLWEYVGKKIRVTLKDGEILEGIVQDYTDQEDTDNDYDSLDMFIDGKYIGVGEPEIKSIQIIE